MSEPVLAIRGLRAHLHHGRRDRCEVLKGADLDVAAGEIVGLVGPSGSGKSSLLHAAGLLEHPTAGRILIDGQDCGSARRPRAHAHPADPASASSTSSTTCCRSSRALRQCRPAAHDRRPEPARGAGARRALLGQLGLAERLDHQPAQLSGGEQQRVAVARALANAPAPAARRRADRQPRSGDLARRCSQNLHDLVRTTGVAALIATHNLAMTRHMDRVLTVRDGRVVPLD